MNASRVPRPSSCRPPSRSDLVIASGADEQHDRPDDRSAASSDRSRRRGVAQRRQRGDPAGPAGRHEGRRRGDQVPTAKTRSRCGSRRSSARPAAGRRRRRTGLEPERDADAGDQPDERAEQADDDGLEQHGPPDLAAARAEHRIRASSRVRWATSIEKVLKMRKVPTKSAISAKTSRKVLKKPSPSLTSLACSSADLLAGDGLRRRRAAPGGSGRAARSR